MGASADLIQRWLEQVWCELRDVSVFDAHDDG